MDTNRQVKMAKMENRKDGELKADHRKARKNRDQHPKRHNCKHRQNPTCIYIYACRRRRRLFTNKTCVEIYCSIVE